VRLKDAGKIRLIGLSNVSVGELERAQRITPIVSVQNRYNLQDRSSERMIERCREQGIAFLPWAPLDGGRDAVDPAKRRWAVTRAARAASRLTRVAQRHGVTTAEVALAWLLARSHGMLPIPGTSSPEHAVTNIGAANLRLTAVDLRDLK
jgi:aryl-alcohol dehydrogenase-like predicted oxidoreductase